MAWLRSHAAFLVVTTPSKSIPISSIVFSKVGTAIATPIEPVIVVGWAKIYSAGVDIQTPPEASGGVWISTPAEYIFAQPTTITGSIGVAIAVPTFENTMDEIGIDFDGVVTTKNAAWDLSQAMPPEIKDAIQDDTVNVYNRFVSLVAESRNESEEYIRTIAEGRVWIGTKALELNLIDEIGNFDDAVAKAAELAGLEEYEVDFFKETLDPEIQALLELTESFDIKLIDQQTLNSFKSMTEILNDVLQVSKPTTLVACRTCEVALQ